MALSSRREQAIFQDIPARMRVGRKVSVRGGAALLLTAGFMGTFALPAYANDELPENYYYSDTPVLQTLSVSDGVVVPVQIDTVGATTAGEIEAAVAAEAEAARVEAARVAEEEAKLRAEKLKAQAATASAVVRDVPVGAGASGLIAAARAQLGDNQDCTALVERSLRAVGYQVGDLGPMGFGAYGTQVAADQVQPGDIMMRGTHVAIYTGDGVNHRAIHGGWLGNQTVETSVDANPGGYSVIIRIP